MTTEDNCSKRRDTASALRSGCLQLFAAANGVAMPLPYADGGVRCGFPSPAQDYISQTIDLNRELIEHPAATFYARVVGDSMADEGIEENDILVIDKSIEPEHGDLAVCCIDGEFTLKRLRFLPGGHIRLMPSNRRYRPIDVTPGMGFMVWGVVTFTIKANRRRRPGNRAW